VPHGGRALRDTFPVPKKTYTQMLEEIERLKRQAEEVRRREVEEVISRMKAAIAFYGLTEEDLGFKKPEKSASAPPAPAPAAAKKKKRKSRYTERPLAGPVRARR
jgi:DNA-binding protein H-NS